RQPPSAKPAPAGQGYSWCIGRVWRSAHHRVTAKPRKAAVIAATMTADSIGMVRLSPQYRGNMTEPTVANFDRNQILRTDCCCGAVDVLSGMHQLTIDLGGAFEVAGGGTMIRDCPPPAGFSKAEVATRVPPSR